MNGGVTIDATPRAVSFDRVTIDATPPAVSFDRVVVVAAPLGVSCDRPSTIATPTGLSGDRRIVSAVVPESSAPLSGTMAARRGVRAAR
jgi:hypothetical protein